MVILYLKEIGEFVDTSDMMEEVDWEAIFFNYN